ncbi:MAG: TIGR03943 family protein [Clostridia bacterium]|jgi:putative membrane protein|nr:TIGR03943 family protein [Clostridia bacterium]
MFRRNNKEAIIQIILLLATACLLMYAIISKEATYYVHPRFFLGIKVSIVIIVLFAISLLSKIHKARHNVSLRRYMIFVIPLVAAILFPASGVSGKETTMSISNFSPYKNNQVNTDTNNNTNSNAGNTYDYSGGTENSSSYQGDSQSFSGDTTNINSYPDNDAGLETSSDDSKDYSEQYSQYEKDGVMVINDDIFAQWYCDLYAHPDSFKGKRCQYLAQVYSMDDGKPNQFLAGRYFMVCCIADLVGYGIICESDKRSQLKDDEWITVTGTIDECEYNGSVAPILKDVTITKAQAPDIVYVYYNGN